MFVIILGGLVLFEWLVICHPTFSRLGQIFGRLFDRVHEDQISCDEAVRVV